MDTPSKFFIKLIYKPCDEISFIPSFFVAQMILQSVFEGILTRSFQSEKSTQLIFKALVDRITSVSKLPNLQDPWVQSCQEVGVLE